MRSAPQQLLKQLEAIPWFTSVGKKIEEPVGRALSWEEALNYTDEIPVPNLRSALNLRGYKRRYGGPAG